MFRYLERSENTARLVEAGHRIALTRPSDPDDEWTSILSTTGSQEAFDQRHDDLTSAAAIDFMLRDRSNPLSVMASVEAARTNARNVRNALTREVWEATNECWMNVSAALAKPIGPGELPQVLALIRWQNSLVRGAMHGTTMRSDRYDFANIGMMIERASNTARILDVKYYVLLPAAMPVGSRLDNVQWETILRSVSAHRSFHWTYPGDTKPREIADFLILDRRMPRSLSFCYAKIVKSCGYLAARYEHTPPSHQLAADLRSDTTTGDIDAVFERGLHEYLRSCIAATNTLAQQLEADYRFTA